MFGLSSFLNRACSLGRNPLTQQTRNTYVLKRRYPLPLHKKGGRLNKMRSRHFVYDFVKDENIVRQPDIKIVLKEFVEGVGNAGDVMSMRPFLAYKTMLLPGHAVYATPENLEKYKLDETEVKDEQKFSSAFVQRTIKNLQRLVLLITMNKKEPWTLEPWHIKASFRKQGFIVPEYAIEMPPVLIKGPDLSLQNKEFYVTVTINKKEKVKVRCRIHHWATGLEIIPLEEDYWKQPAEALMPEQAAVLAEMPLPK